MTTTLWLILAMGFTVSQAQAQWNNLQVQTYEASPTATAWITIQPKDATTWVVTASWTDLNAHTGLFDQVSTSFAGRDLEDAATGNTLSNPTVRLARAALVEETASNVNWLPETSSGIEWSDVGEFTPFTMYNNKQFGSGHGGVVLETSVGNFRADGGAIYIDDDGVGADDIRIYIGHDPYDYPLGGYFQISGPIPDGKTFADLWGTDNFSVSGAFGGTHLNLNIVNDLNFSPTVIEPKAGSTPNTPARIIAFTSNETTPGNYDFSWESESGKVYDLVSTTDLTSGEPLTWAVWDSRTDLTATPPANVLENVPGGGDSKRFFSIIEKSAPSSTP